MTIIGSHVLGLGFGVWGLGFRVPCFEVLVPKTHLLCRSRILVLQSRTDAPSYTGSWC